MELPSLLGIGNIALNEEIPSSPVSSRQMKQGTLGETHITLPHYLPSQVGAHCIHITRDDREISELGTTNEEHENDMSVKRRKKKE